MADYFGLNKILSMVLLIFPLTAWALGVATRCKERRFVAACLRFIFGGWAIWISDLVSTCANKCEVKIARCVEC